MRTRSTPARPSVRVTPLYFAPGAITLGLDNMGIRPSPGSEDVVGIVSFGDFALGVGITSGGHPVLNIDIRDEHDAPLLVVKEGELRVSPANWDVDFVGPRLTLRSALRKTVLDVVLDAPGGTVEVISANFYLHGIQMLAGKQAQEGGIRAPSLEELVGAAHPRRCGHRCRTAYASRFVVPRIWSSSFPGNLSSIHELGRETPPAFTPKRKTGGVPCQVHPARRWACASVSR